MSRPIRLGFIGLSVSGGWAANLVAPLLPPSPLASKYTNTALCTRSVQSARATAEKYEGLLGHPVKAYYGPSGYDDIANDPEVDMVVVAVKYRLVVNKLAADKTLGLKEHKLGDKKWALLKVIGKVTACDFVINNIC